MGQSPNLCCLPNEKKKPKPKHLKGFNMMPAQNSVQEKPPLQLAPVINTRPCSSLCPPNPSAAAASPLPSLQRGSVSDMVAGS